MVYPLMTQSRHSTNQSQERSWPRTELIDNCFRQSRRIAILTRAAVIGRSCHEAFLAPAELTFARLSVAFECYGEVAQATRDNDGNPTNPHWRIPATNHN